MAFRNLRLGNGPASYGQEKQEYSTGVPVKGGVFTQAASAQPAPSAINLTVEARAPRSYGPRSKL